MPRDTITSSNWVLCYLVILAFSSPVSAENILPPAGSPKFLTLPYDDQAVELGQGWYYDEGDYSWACENLTLDLPSALRHCAIDYMKGPPGARVTFEVLAAAPGCATRFDSSGAAGTLVYVRHDATAPDGRRFYSRYLHLDPAQVNPSIPYSGCFSINRGDSIGWSGNSGIPNEQIHLHFGVVIGGADTANLTSNRVDPYDVAGGLLLAGISPIAAMYPPNDPTATCGENHLWINCPGQTPRGDENADVALVLDSSGSMIVNDPLNKRLEAARAFLVAAVPGDQVAIVDFDHLVRLASPLSPLPSAASSLRDAIATIDSYGGTNIGLGIQAACDALLDSTTGNTFAFGILLTDGYGSFAGQDACFSDRGWPIYTFGIGNADNQLLDLIAQNTGGEFKSLPTSSLICEFQAVRAKVAGLPVPPCTSLYISPYQTIMLARIVPASQSVATFTSSWIGSDVEMTLISPSGRVITRSSSGVDIQHDHGAAFEVFSIENPESGEWSIELYGADIPASGEEVVFGFTTIPKQVIEVVLDIKPGDSSNAINPKSKGVIPVAIISTDDFDALTISPSSLRFGSEAASMSHDHSHPEDVDGDGLVDLVIHFPTQGAGITCGTMSATVVGETISGDAIEGADSVVAVGCH